MIAADDRRYADPPDAIRVAWTIRALQEKRPADRDSALRLGRALAALARHFHPAEVKQ